MMSFVIVLHVLVCVVLITIILIQRGRGGGFVEGFSGLESMFGTKTSAFLTKSTSVLAVTFFVTCLLLAGLSLQKSKSLMRGIKKKAVPVESKATEQKTQDLPQGPSATGVTPAAVIPEAGQKQAAETAVPAAQPKDTAQQPQTDQPAQGQ